MREAELTDRLLAMKGYREFSPVPLQTPTVIEPIENEDENYEWKERSIYASEGFEPF